MTRPPNSSTRPRPSISFTPSTKSRSAPAAARRVRPPYAVAPAMPRGSKARELGMRQPAGVHMHAGVLGTARKRRHGLAGIEQPLRIESALHGVEQLELVWPELRAHLVDLLDAHAVLAGDRAADRHALLQHLGRELLGAMELVGAVGVEQDERVQIAVPGME